MRVRVHCWCQVLSDNGRGEVPCPLSKAVDAGCGSSGFISEGCVCGLTAFIIGRWWGMVPCRRIVGRGRQWEGVGGGCCLTMVGYHVVIGRGDHRQGGGGAVSVVNGGGCWLRVIIVSIRGGPGYRR